MIYFNVFRLSLYLVHIVPGWFHDDMNIKKLNYQGLFVAGCVLSFSFHKCKSVRICV